MDTEPAKKKTLARHVQLAVRKRWVQLSIAGLVWLFACLVSIAALKPKPVAKGDTSQFKFIRCDVCNMELPYNPEVVYKRCPKCLPPKTGFLMPSTESIMSGGGGHSPWRWVNSALFVESVALLAAIVYLLYLPTEDPTKVYYLAICPHCGQRLRFRAISLGGVGACALCKRMFRFPDEEEAVLESAAFQAEAPIMD